MFQRNEVEALPSRTRDQEEDEKKKIMAKNLMELITQRLQDLETNYKGASTESINHRPPLLMMGWWPFLIVQHNTIIIPK